MQKYSGCILLRSVLKQVKDSPETGDDMSIEHHRKLRYFANAGIADYQYELSIYYCILNKPKQVSYWLRKAAAQRHEKAIEFLDELLEKKLIE